MTNVLRESLARRAHAVEPPTLDMQALVLWARSVCVAAASVPWQGACWPWPWPWACRPWSGTCVTSPSQSRSRTLPHHPGS